jgi:hypothetical protein
MQKSGIMKQIPKKRYSAPPKLTKKGGKESPLHPNLTSHFFSLTLNGKNQNFKIALTRTF